MKYMALLVFLSVLDIMSTHIGFGVGAREANPMMEHPINTWWGMGLKVVLTLLVAYSLVYKRDLFNRVNAEVWHPRTKKQIRFILKSLTATMTAIVVMMTLVIMWNVAVIIYLVSV